MKVSPFGRLVLAAALLLTFSGCFTVIVQHTAVAHGRIEKGPAEAYIKSPDTVVEVRQETKGVSPRISIKVSVDSSEGLKELSYEVQKGGPGTYRTVASDSRTAKATVDSTGAKKWSTHLEMPAILDLAGTGSAPLLLRVTAEQQDGTMQVVVAKYRELAAE